VETVKNAGLRMDRGGLWYVKETTFLLFLAIEEETRQCLKTLSSSHMKCKQEIVMSITSDEDVLFYWVISTADFEVENKEIHDNYPTKHDCGTVCYNERVLLCKYVDRKV